MDSNWGMSRAAGIRKGAWLLAAIAIGLVPGLVVANHRSYSNVNFKVNSGAQVSIFKHGGKDDEPGYNSKSQPLFSFTGSKHIRIKDGLYVSVLADPNHLYQHPVSLIRITPYTYQLTINQDYSAQKLAEMLPSARQGALNALEATYPPSLNTYTVAKDGLYGQGDWYGALITPADQSEDSVRVILHKSGSGWKIATDPNLMIGAPSNPSVPSSVVQAVDNL